MLSYLDANYLVLVKEFENLTGVYLIAEAKQPSLPAPENSGFSYGICVS